MIFLDWPSFSGRNLDIPGFTPQTIKKTRELWKAFLALKWLLLCTRVPNIWCSKFPTCINQWEISKQLFLQLQNQTKFWTLPKHKGNKGWITLKRQFAKNFYILSDFLWYPSMHIVLVLCPTFEMSLSEISVSKTLTLGTLDPSSIETTSLIVEGWEGQKSQRQISQNLDKKPSAGNLLFWGESRLQNRLKCFG